MKVRVCPKCGKHNSESAWYCDDCGETLSIKSLVDMEELKASQSPIAGKAELSRISPHFYEDVAELFDTQIQGEESVIRGCNITQPSTGAPFKFGYLIVTSQRLIEVQFESELKRKVAESALSLGDPLASMAREAYGANMQPMRPYLEIWPSRSTRTPALAVDNPRHPPSPPQRSSRQVTVYQLKDLASVQLESIGYTGTFVMNLTANFRQGKKMTVAFYAPDEAEEIGRLLTARLGK